MHYAKKREHVQAVRWLGEVTAELAALLGDRKFVIGVNRRMVLGNGWYADIGDWIVADGEKVVVIGDEVFKRVYEGVSEIDVRRVVKLTESVTDAFRNYVDGTGFDAKQLAAVVPKLLDDHVHLAALKRAGYGVEEIRRLDAENERLRERAENAETSLKAPEVHWECQQRIDALENARRPADENRLKQIRMVVDAVACLDRHFVVTPVIDDLFTVHVEYLECDVDDPDPNAAPALQKSRRWLIEPDADESAIVDTCFGCVMRSYDHVVQEHFTYEGVRVFSPHVSVDARLAMGDGHKLENDRQARRGKTQ